MLKKNKKNNVVFIIITLAIAMVLVVAVGISAENKSRLELTGKSSSPQNGNTQKTKTIQTPSTFVPSDSVSADQSVPFPTDI